MTGVGDGPIEVGDPIFRVHGLSKRYGAIKALDRVDFTVSSGELCGVIGPNGSGKTTFFDCCTGLVKPDSGAVFLRGEDITRWPMHRIAREGAMMRTFQRNVVFRSLTVNENLILAGQMRAFPSLVSTFLQGRATGNRLGHLRSRASELLELVGLQDARSKKAAELSLGQQRLLQFAAALMPAPRLLLLDEPLAGVNPVMIEQIVNAIRRVNTESRATLVIIEHNVDVIMTLCARVVVFNAGQKIAEGSPADIVNNPDVVQAYLGG